MQDIIIDFMNDYGYFGIMFLIMIENVFPPIPSEIVLGLGGYMTKMTNLTLFGVIFISTIGSCLGALILYYFGFILNNVGIYRLSNSRLRRLSGLNVADIDKTINWFLKKGSKTILFGRFIPVIRSLISIPAGISRMPLWKFILLTAIGTFIWNGFLTILGMYLGQSWYKIENFMRKYLLLVIIILIILIIVLIVKFVKRVNLVKRI